MKATIKDGILTITLAVEPSISKSGKSLVIASTHGNVQTACTHEGQNVTIGVNAYTPVK